MDVTVLIWCLCKISFTSQSWLIFVRAFRWARYSLVRVSYRGRDKIAAISQTTFSNAFSWMKICEFHFRFHWKFFPNLQINNIPALVQIMAWRRPGDEPLSEPMMLSLVTYICVTRPQWVNIVMQYSWYYWKFRDELIHTSHKYCHQAWLYCRYLQTNYCNIVMAVGYI